MEYDYTEGATAKDIEAVAKETRGRRRRDSQVSVDGAVFDGPQAALFPSSVSSFHRERPLWRHDSRRQSMESRRQSMGSRRQSMESRRQSAEEDAALLVSDTEDEPTSPKIARQNGMFSSWTGLFRARSPESPTRPSLSRRTSAALSDGETSVQNWSDAFGSEASVSPPPSPTASLPILTGGGDPFFGGEARIDVSPPASLYDDHAQLPDSRQNVYVADEDARLRLTGYTRVGWRNVLWHVVTVLSVGILALVGRWIPRMWLRFVAKEVPFTDASFVVVETEHSDFILQPIQTIDYPYPLDTAFNPIPSSMNHTPGTATPLPDAHGVLAAIASRDPSVKSRAPSVVGISSGNGITTANGTGSGNGNGTGNGVPKSVASSINGSTLAPPTNGIAPSTSSTLKPNSDSTTLLSTLSFIDYRYTRFVLDPRTRQFTMLRTKKGIGEIGIGHNLRF
ncbi:hypothetical protein FRC07_014864 [Ceratobasidium sp. 392]|nr:hypothetical protein FRC07_014864 [Ceratobasidium sp. 392]